MRRKGQQQSHALEMRPAEVRVSTSMHGTWALEQFSHAGTFPSHLCRWVSSHSWPAGLVHTLMRRSRHRSQARRTFLGCLEPASMLIDARLKILERACARRERAQLPALANHRAGDPAKLGIARPTYAPLLALASARHTQSHNLLTVFPSPASPCRSGALRPRPRNHPSPSLNPNPANYYRHVRLIRLALSAFKKCKHL